MRYTVRPHARRESRSLCVRVLGRVICDVSGPIGCHLSSRCRRVPPVPSPFLLVLFWSLSLSLSISLPCSFASPSLILLLFSRLSFSLSTTLNATRGPEDAIRSALPSPSHICLRVTSPLGLTHAIAFLPSSLPVPSRGFSPLLRTPWPRSFPLRHCASFHPQPSLVSSRSFQRRCQWRVINPFSANRLHFIPFGEIISSFRR